MINLYSILKSRDITLPTKIHTAKAMVSPVVMSGCESWTIKKAEHQRLDAFELWCRRRRRLLTVLDFKEIKPVNLKGNQSWIFIGRTDAEAEAPILWPPDTKIHLFEKDPDAVKDWGQKRVMEEMVGWHCQFNGHESEQTLGDGKGQGSLACCSPWGHKKSQDWTTEQQQTYLAESGLSFGTWGLRCGTQILYLWHEGLAAMRVLSSRPWFQFVTLRCKMDS